MRPETRIAELANGLRLPYVEQGNPAEAPVILLHGVTDSWRSFEPVLPWLPDSIHAFALTQRGHGDADRPASGYSSRDFAGDLAGFMDTVSIERPVVVGHSMGSFNALRFAIEYPERIRGLVLLGAFAAYRDKPDLVDYVKSSVAGLTDPIDEAFVRDFQQSTLAQPVPSALLETAVQESLKVPARVWRAVFGGFLDDELGDAFDTIRVPTLIVWGDRDAYCPRRDQEILRTAIQGARLLVYSGAGHALHWEEPRRFAADLAAFVAWIAFGIRRRNPARRPAGRRLS